VEVIKFISFRVSVTAAVTAQRAIENNCVKDRLGRSMKKVEWNQKIGYLTTLLPSIRFSMDDFTDVKILALEEVNFIFLAASCSDLYGRLPLDTTTIVIASFIRSAISNHSAFEARGTVERIECRLKRTLSPHRYAYVVCIVRI